MSDDEYYDDYDGETEVLCDIAAYEIGKFLLKWGRIPVRQTKAKFGTVRVYCSFGYYSFHCFFNPQHIFVRWPKWLYGIDLQISSYIMPILNKIVIPYQQFIYRRAYERAVKRFPTITGNILCCADFPEVLEQVKNKYWKTNE